MTLRYILADVFTDRPFGGNPLAVFPDAAGLSTSAMARIAGELNLSESVFVLPAERPDAAARLRIFTPRVELPFAGHPTVGAACVLAEEGLLEGASGAGAATPSGVGATTPSGGGAARPSGGGSTAPLETSVVFEEAVGPIAVTVLHGPRGPMARFRTATLPEAGPPPPPTPDLARLLALAEEDIGTGHFGPGTASCGVPFTVIPVRDRAALGCARLEVGVWEDLLRDTWAPHVYVVADPGERVTHARMFAPAMGIPEDPATGAAAAAFAGYLAAHSAFDADGATDRLKRTIRQGEDMGRPSEIELGVTSLDGAVSEVSVGGGCVRIGEGRMAIPED